MCLGRGWGGAGEQPHDMVYKHVPKVHAGMLKYILENTLKDTLKGILIDILTCILKDVLKDMSKGYT